MSNPNRRQPVPASEAQKAETPAAVPAAEPAQASEAPKAEIPGADPEPPAAAPEGEQVEARVLVSFEGYDANDVAIIDVADVERLAGEGKIDPHPDAVAYAKSLTEG